MGTKPNPWAAFITALVFASVLAGFQLLRGPMGDAGFFNNFALHPRDTSHLGNIATYVLPHTGLSHLLSNLVITTFLTYVLVRLRGVLEYLAVLSTGILMTGAGLWVAEDPQKMVVGASGLLAVLSVYALVCAIASRVYEPEHPYLLFLGLGGVSLTFVSILNNSSSASSLAHWIGLFAGMILGTWVWRRIERQDAEDPRINPADSSSEPGLL